MTKESVSPQIETPAVRGCTYIAQSADGRQVAAWGHSPDVVRVWRIEESGVPHSDGSTVKKDEAKTEFASVADGWLIAYAKANGGVVVTKQDGTVNELVTQVGDLTQLGQQSTRSYRRRRRHR